ncbi:beta-propeller fold lactonase family protein [Kangiella sp. M94]
MSKQTDYITDRAIYSTFSPDDQYLYTSSLIGGLGVFKITSTGYEEQQVIAQAVINTPYMNSVYQAPLYMDITQDGKLMFVANRTLSTTYESYGDGIDVYKRDLSTGEITQVHKYLTWQDNYDGLEKVHKFLLTEQDNLLITINLVGGISTNIIDTNSGELTQLNKYDINTPGFENFQGPTDIIEIGDKKFLVVNPSSNYIHLLEYSETGEISIIDKVSTQVSASIESPTKIVETQSPNRFLFLGETGLGAVEIINESTINIDQISWDGQTQNLLRLAGLAYNKVNDNHVAISKDTGALITFNNNGNTNTALYEQVLTMGSRNIVDASSVISSNSSGSRLSITGYKHGVVALLKTTESSNSNYSVIGHDNNEISKLQGVAHLESLGKNELLSYGEKAFSKFHFDEDQKILVQDYYVLLEETTPIPPYITLRGVQVSHDKNHIYATFSGNKGESGINTYSIERESKQINKIDYINGDSLNIDNFRYGHVLGDSTKISISPNDDFLYFPNEQYDYERYSSYDTLEIFGRTPANGLLNFEGRYIDDNTQRCKISPNGGSPSQATIVHTKDDKFVYAVGRNTISILQKGLDGQLSCIQNTSSIGLRSAPFSMALLNDDNYLVTAETYGVTLFSRDKETGLLSELDTWSLSDENNTVNGLLDNVRQIIKHPHGNRFFAVASDTTTSHYQNYLGYFKINKDTQEIELIETVDNFYSENQDVKALSIRDWTFSSNGEYLHFIQQAVAQFNIWNLEILEKSPTNIESANLQATDNEMNQITIYWAQVSNSSVYQIYVSDTQNSGFSLLSETSSLEYTHGGLEASSTKYYKVKACNDMGCTDFSNPARGNTLEQSSENDNDEETNNNSSGGGAINLYLLLIMITSAYIRLSAGRKKRY